MKEIPLTQGKIALVDDDDFERINAHKWFYDSQGYAARNIHAEVSTVVRMHREVAGTPVGMATDHANGDKLDNRKENLRACTISQNGANRGARRTNPIGLKGVAWSPAKRKWRSRIRRMGRDYHLGYFDTPREAAYAYDAAALAHFGEFAKLNYPERLAEYGE